jgi:hypothetical protein
MGTIEVQRNVRWSCAGWLFRWVLETLAAVVPASETSAKLREVIDENLGWLALDDLPLPERTKLRESIYSDLLAQAEDYLPADYEGREGALNLVRELAQLAGRSLDSTEPV